jgi:leucyl-tRNA synthetase
MAIWKNDNYLPRSYYVNGYLLLNGEKMSKHTGNFLTMKDAIEKYGVSATRFALASNDGIEDGDFVTKLAESAILKLHGEYEWISKTIQACDDPFEMTIWDKIFEYEICTTMKQADTAYKNAKYGSVIKAFYAIVNAKDEYKKSQSSVCIDLLRKYAQTVITIMYPICTAWSENLKKEFNDSINYFRINSIMTGKRLNEDKWKSIDIDWNLNCKKIKILQRYHFRSRY